jgi:integrase
MTTAAKPGRSSRPGSVRFREDRDMWEARVRLPNGKRPSAYFKAEREGWAWISKMMTDAARGACVVDSSQRTGDVLRLWLRDVAPRNLRPNSLDNYRRCIGYVLPWIGNIKLKDLKRPHVEKTFAGLARGDSNRPALQPATLNLAFRVLKMALDYCEDAEYVARNPMARMKAPRTAQTKDRVLSLAEIEAILQEACGTRWAALFFVLAATGMRASEVLGLEWRNIDLDTGLIRVERQTGRIYGQPGVRLVSLKTKASTRTVQVPGEVCRVLRHHADVQRLERKRAEACGTWEDHGTVFCGPTGKLYFRSRPMDELRRIASKLGIEAVTLHTFRHTVITLLQDSGLPMKAAQALAGHATERTTAQVYSHAMPEHLGRVADAMGQTLAEMQLPSCDLILTDDNDPWNTSGGQPGGHETPQTA